MMKRSYIYANRNNTICFLQSIKIITERFYIFFGQFFRYQKYIGYGRQNLSVWVFSNGQIILDNFHAKGRNLDFLWAHFFLIIRLLSSALTEEKLIYIYILVTKKSYDKLFHKIYQLKFQKIIQINFKNYVEKKKRNFIKITIFKSIQLFIL